jgi:tryptophan synthase beta chain
VDTTARLVGVEAAGGSAVDKGKLGVLHGFMSHFLQDDDSQVLEAHSISAGLDYPGVGPEHVHLASIGRVHYTSVTDEQAMRALKLVTRTEGILPALESAHALAWVVDAAATGELPAGSTVLVTLSGRGDKDIDQIREHLR